MTTTENQQITLAQLLTAHSITMTNSPKPLAEVCKEIGARIEDYTGSTSGPHGTPYQHSQYSGGKVVTVIYPLPNDFDRTFGPLGVSDARIVGVTCGPIVHMEMLSPTPQPEQEQEQEGGEPLLTGYFCGLRGLSLDMTQEQAESASHAGSCDNDVAYLVGIAEQINKLDPQDIAAALREAGAWDAEEIADAEQNRHRAVWLAACDIRDNPIHPRGGHRSGW